MGRYRVTAKSRVLGHEPDTTFEADLDPNQERRLLESGALIVTKAKKVDTVDRDKEQ